MTEAPLFAPTIRQGKETRLPGQIALLVAALVIAALTAQGLLGNEYLLRKFGWLSKPAPMWAIVVLVSLLTAGFLTVVARFANASKTPLRDFGLALVLAALGGAMVVMMGPDRVLDPSRAEAFTERRAVELLKDLKTQEAALLPLRTAALDHLDKARPDTAAMRADIAKAREAVKRYRTGRAKQMADGRKAVGKMVRASTARAVAITEWDEKAGHDSKAIARYFELNDLALDHLEDIAALFDRKEADGGFLYGRPDEQYRVRLIFWQLGADLRELENLADRMGIATDKK